jgi:hypothetical protein
MRWFFIVLKKRIQKILLLWETMWLTMTFSIPSSKREPIQWTQSILNSGSQETALIMKQNSLLVYNAQMNKLKNWLILSITITYRSKKLLKESVMIKDKSCSKRELVRVKGRNWQMQIFYLMEDSMNTISVDDFWLLRLILEMIFYISF